MITAAEALSSTRNVIEKRSTEALERMVQKINEAIQRGDYSTVVSIGNESPTIRQTIVQSLRDIGFEVIDTNGMDQRDYGSLKISWLNVTEQS